MVTSSRKKKKPKLPRADGSVVVECKQQDVLMGRGKRISRWPGNIYFRQLVNQHRDEYVGSHRTKKFKIANTVVEEVLKIGGRFLDVQADGRFVEIGMSRALEKACQALREKEKCHPPTAYPFDFKKDMSPPIDSSVEGKSKAEARKVSPISASKKRNLPSSGKQIRKKVSSISKVENENSKRVKEYEKVSPRQIGTKTSNSDHVKIGIREGINGAHASPHNQGGKITDEDDDEDQEEVHDHEENELDGNEKDETPPSVEENPIYFLKSIPNEVMLRKLVHFHNLYGHVAVPPGWPENQMLADWCTVQRQLYRQVVVAKGHRAATIEEEALLKRLSELNFVWDYESWHWDQQYEQLQLLMQQSRKETVKMWLLSSWPLVTNGEVDPEAANIIDWFHDQQRQHQEGDQPLLYHRAHKLQQLGLPLTSNDQ